MREESGDPGVGNPDAPGYVLCREADGEIPGQTLAQLANKCAASRPGADLALVLGDASPPAEWVERLRSCAARESTAATVSPMPGPILPGGGAVQELLRSEPVVLNAGAGSPRVNLAGGAVVYIARAAFDLLGGLDETMPTGAGAIAAFGLRARARGLANLLAGDLLVPPPVGAELSDRDRTELARRFPLLWQAALDPPSAAVEHSRALARAAIRRPTVTIDARSLGARIGGTQVYAYELIKALARREKLDIRALVGPDAEAKAQLEALDGVSVITYEQALENPGRTDLVHRPQQVFTLDDLALLRPLGDRLVISHLDLIAYHNPTYFPTPDEWRRHVRATRIAFEVADHLLFFSTYALGDAEREDLVDVERASVVHPGVDAVEQADAPTCRPAGLGDREEPMLLCIGADYSHKNRPFALELAAELRGSHDWPGIIVLAGPHVAHGSSAEAERGVIEEHPQLERAAIDLGPVSDAERRWLMAHASALVYPTVLEGFGLVPFEAATAGVPCLFAGQSSLAELLPVEAATLDGWNLERSGARAATLLNDDGERARHVQRLRRAAREYRWELCAERTIEAYHRTLASAARSSARQAWEALQREREIVRLDQAVAEIQAKHEAFLQAVGADGLALVGPDGLLSGPDRRALLALAARPGLSRPVFAVTRTGYRLARRGKEPS